MHILFWICQGINVYSNAFAILTLNTVRNIFTSFIMSHLVGWHAALCGLQNFHLKTNTVIFLPARPASQTHDSHKGRMILNHESPAGRIKNCDEKSAFGICNFCFECFFYLHTVS